MHYRRPLARLSHLLTIKTALWVFVALAISQCALTQVAAQESQSTPMRVIDWGKGAPQGGLQPIYR